MKTNVTMVRVYCSEAGLKLDKLLNILHDQEKVAGVTAFRGIAGFGKSGHFHTASLLDMSLDMPVIIEFFDRPEKIAAVVDHLRAHVKPGHMVSWDAMANLEQD